MKTKTKIAEVCNQLIIANKLKALDMVAASAAANPSADSADLDSCAKALKEIINGSYVDEVQFPTRTKKRGLKC